MTTKTFLKFYQELPADLRDQVHTHISQDFIQRLEEKIGVERPASLVHLMDIYEQAKKLQRTKGVLTGLSTGLPTLDDISGGLDKQELIIITGETGTGKTNLAMNILYHLAERGEPVLFFTLEMSLLEVAQRFIELHEGDDSIAAWPIHFFGGHEDVTTKVLRDTIREAITVHGVRCVCIDHLHYFAKSAQNQREELEIITREIKLLAREFDIPIILVAHTRRLQATQSRPYLSDIKDTSAVAQDADQVIIVWRDTKTTDPTERYTLHFEVAKNRLKGKCAAASFRIRKNYLLADDKLTTNDIQEVFV